MINPEKKYYNFTNLNIKCYYSDKESIDSYNNKRTKLKVLKEITKIPIYQHPFILIEEKNSEIFKQYKYLIIQVEEIVPIN